MKRVLGLACFLVAVACSSHRWPNVPNPSETGVPGELQKDWEASHPAATFEPGLCTNRAPTGISEIAIEKTPCYGFCPTYTLHVYLDGRVEYYGQANVARVGRHIGTLDPQWFHELARVAIDIGFFEMEDDYSCGVTDQETVFVAVVRDGITKTVRHYGPFFAGPPRLRLFEDAIEQYAHHIEWPN